MMCNLVVYVLLLVGAACAGFDLGRHGGDEDLTSFVTRPEIKVPRFNVTNYSPDQVVAGYWFIAPYTKIEQPHQAPKYYQACQTGPAIYDQTGELIWTGACYFRNQNAYDFRAWRENDTEYLSTIVLPWADVLDYKGHAIILDNTFTPTDRFHVPNTMTAINMHEFKVIDRRRALHIGIRPVLMDFDELQNDYDGAQVGLVADLGIREVDLDTNKVLFEWWASDHISLDDSSAKVSKLGGPYPTGWNWFHMNSVDKNADGDYMISARYTNSIYKISGQNGSLLWSLGGRSSSFTLDGDFNFSRQHDARFLSQTETTETITFLDNGADEYVQTASTSSALIVTLDKVTMTARVEKCWTRPDGKLSRLRGNFQLLENGNAFVGWSDNGVISEFSPRGDVLLQASFASDRFVTYRTYKANFTSVPMELPILVAQVYGVSIEHCITVFWVSWNGATEVKTWEFWRVDTNGVESLICRTPRSGFETMIQAGGYEGRVFAQAVSIDGNVLGRSEEQESRIMGDWQDTSRREVVKDSTCSQSDYDQSTIAGQTINRKTEL